jgi:deazaflavin-dependent oxidoreductase (nitroreductase family)
MDPDLTEPANGRWRRVVNSWQLSGLVPTRLRPVSLETMPLQGEYEPSPIREVREQVARYESSGGTEGTTFQGTMGPTPLEGPVIILTSKGAKSGKIRKSPVMRVEHEGRYLAIASLGGSPKNPLWYYNVLSNPHVELQDGPIKQDMIARQVTGQERDVWWARALEAWPNYDVYQERTERVIPVFVLEPTPSEPGCSST